MPKTRLGKWAVGSFLVSVLLFGLVIIGFNTELLGIFAQRTAGGLILWILTALAVLTSLVTGAVSWLRLKDRSVLVIVATIFGFIATVVISFGAIPEN
jgi:hypothetical protein